MRKTLVIVGIAALVAVLGVATLGVVAFAQASEEGSVFPFDFQAKFHQAVADILGISVEKYDSAVEEAQQQVLDEALGEGWLTQEQADRMQDRFDQGFAPGIAPRSGKLGMPGGSPRRGGFMSRAEGDPLSAATEALDMTVEDLRTQLQDGKTIAELAEAKGVDTQPIVDACVATISERLDRAVENGRLTEKQAEWMLEQTRTRIGQFIEKGMPFDNCRPGSFRPGGRPGSFAGQNGP